MKPNTERRIYLWSEMRAFEVFYLNFFYRNNDAKIQIINTETRESFERTLTDISQFDGMWVFSWRAE